MSKFEKEKARLCEIPSDFTYNEVKYLLEKMGFIEMQMGKTSGSRVRFYREYDKKVFMLHKPHPKNIVSKGALRDMVSFLRQIGEL